MAPRLRLGIARDGFIRASDVETALDQLTDALLAAIDQRLSAQDEKIRKLTAELETERRLRLGMAREKSR